ncbi:MAG: hypothetical protein ACI9XO_003856, partial [Paraglaciecola sp.]
NFCWWIESVLSSCGEESGSVYFKRKLMNYER